MKWMGCFAAAAFCSALLAAAACDEDEGLVRPRLDGSAAADATSEGGTLSCGVALPTVYESPSFDANARVEKDLVGRVIAIDTRLRETEGAGTATATADDLKALYSEGSPSLRAVSSTATQNVVDGYFVEYADAIGKTWTPAAADADGGAPSGGKYASTDHVSKTGLALRVATVKVLLGGALFNHVLGLAAAPVSEATVDRFVAALGASPALASRTDDAATAPDLLVAAYASNRDDETSAVPGSYRRLRTALLTMKAAAAAGERCKADLDAGLAIFLREWERVTYASAIHYLQAAAASAASADKGPDTLRAFGEAFGFIQSFKGLPADKRKIQDANIDLVLGKIREPYELVPRPGDRALKLNEAINDITLYEGFTAAEVESFRQSF